ncbi:MAG: PAS domain-containing protein, partial [Burkholderiaceae bacterium]|nr:PAS domain-containing protein [Burkholderiaceae bacterium]
MPVEDDTASGEQFVLITLQDCTDTHQAAQSLSQERQRLLTITAELEEGVLVVDSAMLVSQINDAAARMMGLAVADAVGRHVNDVLIMVNAQTGGNFNNP